MRMSLTLVLLVSSISACAADDSDGGTVAGTATTEGSTGAMTMTTTTSTTATADTTADTTIDPSADSSGPASSGSTDTGPSETTGTAGGACDPAADDTACDECVKGMCCAQLSACADDPDCVCFQDCAASMPPSLEVPTLCGEMCSIDTPFAHPTVGQLLSCSAGCTEDCL